MEASPHSPALKKKQTVKTPRRNMCGAGSSEGNSASLRLGRRREGEKNHVKINGRQPVPVDDDMHLSKLGKNYNS